MRRSSGPELHQSWSGNERPASSKSGSSRSCGWLRAATARASRWNRSAPPGSRPSCRQPFRATRPAEVSRAAVYIAHPAGSDRATDPWDQRRTGLSVMDAGETTRPAPGGRLERANGSNRRNPPWEIELVMGMTGDLGRTVLRRGRPCATHDPQAPPRHGRGPHTVRQYERISGTQTDPRIPSRRRRPMNSGGAAGRSWVVLEPAGPEVCSGARESRPTGLSLEP